MKKVFAFSIGLLMAVSSFGQSIKVTPAFKKGMVKTYAVTSNVTVAGQTINMTSEQKYTITKEVPEGYEMTLETTDFKSDGNQDNPLSRLLTISDEILKNSRIQILLNKEGKVMDIVNYQEVKEKSLTMANHIIDELFESTPEISQVLKKETLREQVSKELTSEKIINGLTVSASPLALFGRTITSGMEDKYNNNIVSLKRIWLVTGKVVGASAKADMSREELKTFILSQVEKMAPQQADMIKENIDQVLNTGLIKLDMSEKSNYELADDLWVKSMTNDMESNFMGQKSDTHTKIQLKN